MICSRGPYDLPVPRYSKARIAWAKSYSPYIEDISSTETSK